jgi:hypothetical protein
MKRNQHKTAGKWYCFFLTQLFCISMACAQSDPFVWSVEGVDNADWRAENGNEYGLIAEERDELVSHPLNLNSATEDDLSRIPGLNSFQQKNLFNYLKEYGEVFSVYELLSVQGFDSALVSKISPYLCCSSASHSPPLNFKNLWKLGKSEFLFGCSSFFPRSEGYRVPDSLKESGANYYPGSPYGISFRYTYTFAGRLAIGFSGDKDPGEQFFAGGQKYGMDYYSGYLSLYPGKILRRVIIGNFRAGWGLGLTFNTGGSLGIYPGFNQEFRAGGGIRPSQSVSEGSNLRGIAVSVGAGRFTLSGICSYRKRDATMIDEDTLKGNSSAFSSFIETGYHRTLAENNKMGAVKEFILGGNLGFRGNFFSLGFTAYSVSLSARLQPRNELYNLLAFSGRNNFVCGADFNIFYRFARFTGELSRSLNGSIAWIAGLNLNPDPRFSAVILYRDYPPDFQNLYANCLRQNTWCANEKAWFLSLSANLPLHLSLNLFSDFCSFPWAKYTVSKPSAANDIGAMLTWQTNSSLSIILRYIYSADETNVVKEDEVVRGTGKESSEDFRIQMNWTGSRTVSLQSRIEIKKSRQSLQQETTGWLLFQDICLKPLKLPLKIILRYSVFDCPFYDSRIWAYEPDVLYAYSMPEYYGQGVRAAALIRFTPKRHFVFCLRAALTRYNNKNTIGSGLDRIDANWRLDLGTQLQFRI